ncbi:enhancer of split m7 protein-like [Cylas formicarius]|uniref:enhancer of split m7 protein-like n=1 Tax=Cylas formicarius TaxID=197179 RepID=UPI00295866BD|nr:enhancer of split m7 protein-like [Cylas formicarius]
MAEDRKIRKPLIEKKRRARINESLEILKNILLECDPEVANRGAHKSAKLEKADILEMTVNYMQRMRASVRQGSMDYHLGANQSYAFVRYKPQFFNCPPKQLYRSGIFQTHAGGYHEMNGSSQVIPKISSPLDCVDSFVRSGPFCPVKVEMISPPSSPNLHNGDMKVCNTSNEPVPEDVWRPW